MLNIAVIRSIEYYLDQVAETRADYYQGRGESPGRWRGSLARRLGLAGTVTPEALRALLEGRHPLTGDLLLAGRSATGGGRTAGTTTPSASDDFLGVAAAADLLAASSRTVRRWASAGEETWRAVQAATPDRILVTATEVRARMAELQSASAAGDDGGEPSGCLLVPPVDGHRRRFDLPRSEVDRLRDLHRGPAARQGYDIVFRPAKGWSVLWAVGPADLRRELLAIHHQAVADALGYLEESAARGRTTVRWLGRRVRVRARGEGFVVACFDHRESRAGDPLLHTHCLVANVTRLPDGRLLALESSGLFRQQRAADAVYRATFLHLAATRLGIHADPAPSVFPEPTGVPAEVISAFSKRSDEIAAEVARHGSTSAAARQLAALATRRAKEVAGRSDDLHRRWQAEAERLGFREADVAACRTHDVGVDSSMADIDAALDRLAAPDGLTAGAATFSRADVVRSLGDILLGGVPGSRLADLADAFLVSEPVVPVREHRPGRPRGRMFDGQGVVDDPSASRYSVAELALTEGRVLAVVEARSGPAVSPWLLEMAIARHPELSAEQISMVQGICSSGFLLRPAVGLPGAGKTTAARVVVEAFQAAGVPVVGCAVTATAADELGRRTGLLTCDTLARTLIDLDEPDGRLQPGTVVIADEASMLPTRSLDRLITHVVAANGTLVLIGDPMQHPAVGPGSFFTRLVTERLDVRTLAENHRRLGPVSDEERAAEAAMRDGRVADALRLRDEAGLLTRAASPSELHGQIVDDWWAQDTAVRDPMIVASNETRSRLNSAARELLRAAGVVTGPILVVDGMEFQAGDRVVARRNDRRLRSPHDGRWWVRNGSCGRIVKVDIEESSVTVAFDTAGYGAPHEIRLPAGYVADHLEHAYALTDYGVQGRTLTRALAVLDETSTTPGAYVATTRGRAENRIYIAVGDAIDTEALDCTHGIPRTRAPGLEALAAQIAARRPEGMLHDRDPYLVEAVDLAAGASPADLQEEVQKLRQLALEVPANPAKSLANAEAALRRLRNHAPTSDNPQFLQRIQQIEATVGRLRRQQERYQLAAASSSKLRRRRIVVAEATAMVANRRKYDREVDR